MTKQYIVSVRFHGDHRGYAQRLYEYLHRWLNAAKCEGKIEFQEMYLVEDE
jgi:hypothetical protein